MAKNYEIKKRLGTKISYIRKSKNLSQIQLSELCDLNFNYIGQIERGIANPILEKIIKLAEALDVEVKDLFDFSF